MRTASYHCPHCKAHLWFLSLKPPQNEKVDCNRCNKPYLLTSRALADAWRHTFACWGFLAGAVFFGVGSLLRLEFVALLMTPMLAFGVAIFAYVLAIPIAAAAANKILAKSGGYEGVRTIKTKIYD